MAGGQSTHEEEGSLVAALRDELASATQQAESAQRRLYDAYAAEGDPLQTGRDHRYRCMVAALREIVREHVPRDSTVLVISRGDDDLLDLYGHTAHHFPREPSGRYAGYHPHNGRAAVARLENQIALGSDFLLIPATGGWWLDHYGEFRDHLRAVGRVVFSDPDVGHLFDLRKPPIDEEGPGSALEELLAEIEAVEGADPSVLDWIDELNFAALLPHRAVFSPLSPAGRRLPYVSGGADVVVVPGGDDRRMTEALRIARIAVAVLSSAEGTAKRLDVTWQATQSRNVHPLVSLVLPCSGSDGRVIAERVQTTLPAHLEWELLVVMSGRQPAWLRTLSSTNARVRIVRPGSRTLAAAYEAGARAARAETLVLLRKDAVPLRGWLAPLLALMETRRDAQVVGGMVLSSVGCIVECGGVVEADGSPLPIGAGDFKIDAPPYSFVREADFCSAGLLATRRKTFLRLRGLDSRYAELGLAFADLCLRATARDGRVYYQPESASVVLQPASASAERDGSQNGHGSADRELLKRSWRAALRRRNARNGSRPGRPGDRVVVREPRRALVVSRRPPEPDRESGSRRVHHLIELLREMGWVVTFGADEDYGAEQAIRTLQQAGIETYVPMHDRLGELFVPGRFDLALIAFWPNVERLLPGIRRGCPETRVIADMVDLHFLREARNLLKGRPAMLLDQEFGFNTARELNAYALADAVLAVSRKEAELVNDLTNDAQRAFVVPDFEELPRSSVRRRDRRGIAFIGNFWHPPNREALRFLFEEIVPRLDPSLLRRHPIRVVGNKLEEALPHVDPIPDGVQLVGWAPSVVPYLEHARISVIPVRTGAGTKRKLVQALMVGTPTVSTSIGIEGVPVREGEHVLVADDPGEFAAAVERLLVDDSLWDRLRRQGREVALGAHGQELVKSSLADALEATFSRPPAPSARLPIELARSAVSADYSRTVEEVREAVRQVTPEASTVYVVNRGDPELISLDGRAGRHFPEDHSGAYAGHHPADSDAAVAFLDSAMEKGGHYLVVPGSAFWWLGRYPGLIEKLDALGSRVWSTERCIVYELPARCPRRQPKPPDRLTALWFRTRPPTAVIRPRRSQPRSSRCGDRL